jgi:hypothetical protein
MMLHKASREARVGEDMLENSADGSDSTGYNDRRSRGGARSEM